MSVAKRKATVTQFRGTEVIQDLNRYASEVRTLFDALKSSFVDRWTVAKDLVTTSTVRSLLKFGETPRVFTGSGDIDLYLPKATTADTGRCVVFLKTSPAHKITLRDNSGARINGAVVAEVRAPGYHSWYWDGSAWYGLRSPDWLDVRDFVARGDGVASRAALNVAGINAAIVAAHAAGGGVVYVPPGEYYVGTIGGALAVDLDTVSNVTLLGAGIGQSTIQLADAADSHVINITNGTNIAIENLTIDGARSAQTLTVHGVRISGVDGLLVRRCEIRQCAYYCLGPQAGALKHMRFSHLWLHHCGADGCDIKNKLNANESCFADNLRISDWGLDTNYTGQAGLDMRGAWQVSGVVCLNPPLDGQAIRFRPGETSEANGFGAHYSHLTNFEVYGSGGVNTQIGVEVDARDCVVHGGRITGTLRGVQVAELRATVIGVTAHDVGDAGFVALAAATLGGADDSVFLGCKALTSADDGFDIRANRVTIQGCVARDCVDDGVSVNATATDTRLRDNYFTSNTSSNVSDGGTDTHASGNEGWVTQANLQSGTLACDSTGTKTAAIPHGLGVAPTVKDVQLAVLLETNVSDYRISLLRVDTVDATNINCRAVVLTASATAGATFRIGARVDARP